MIRGIAALGLVLASQAMAAAHFVFVVPKPGGGLGGAIFVKTGALSLTNVSQNNNRVIGAPVARRIKVVSAMATMVEWAAPATEARAWAIG